MMDGCASGSNTSEHHGWVDSGKRKGGGRGYVPNIRCLCFAVYSLLLLKLGLIRYISHAHAAYIPFIGGSLAAYFLSFFTGFRRAFYSVDRMVGVGLAWFGLEGEIPFCDLDSLDWIMWIGFGLG